MLIACYVSISLYCICNARVRGAGKGLLLEVTVGPCLRDKDRFGVKDKKVRMVFGFGFSKYMCNTQD